MKPTSLLLALAALVPGACDFDISNPNSPPPIGNNPSRSEVAAAATGILLAARQDAADWALDAGIIGREAYRFDGSDPRFISEFLIGPLDPGSGAFGGDHWFELFRTIRSAHNLVTVVPTATALSTQEQNATRGFAETMNAWSFLMVLNAHTQDSIPVDVARDETEAPAPFVTNDSAFAFVSNLLDTASVHLAAGGAAFPFELPSGFAGFATPADFAEFNRALKARVEVYRGSRGCGNPCYTTALTALGQSFVDTSGAATLNVGVYFNFGTGPGDIANFLSQDPQTSDNLVHPSLEDSAETQTAGGLDARLLAKTVIRPARTVSGLTSDRSFTNYPSPGSSLPIIRNEELVLLRAEANNGLGNGAASAADINYIRVRSGGLAIDATLAAATQPARLGVILRERRYSLLYEGGHRWIDMRRTGRLAQVPLDRTGDVVHSRLPIPTDEVLPRQ
ncbi:MAG TPA: RagB/SusD family nutrient uptake outer membrane protein [Gemmatimonadales bacterium]